MLQTRIVTLSLEKKKICILHKGVPHFQRRPNFLSCFPQPWTSCNRIWFGNISGRPPTPSGEETFCRVNEAAVRVFLGREMNNVAIEDLQALETFSKYQGADFTPYWTEATLLITQTAFYTIGCWDHWTFQLLPEALCKGHYIFMVL